MTHIIYCAAKYCLISCRKENKHPIHLGLVYFNVTKIITKGNFRFGNY